MNLGKENKRKTKNLKTRIIILLIIALLANYFLVLSEITGVVLATTEDWNLRKPINFENIVDQDEKEVEDNNTNQVEDTNSVQEEVKEDIVETENNDSVEQETSSSKELTEEQVKDLEKISVNSEINVNNSRKFGERIIVDASLKINSDFKDYKIDEMTINIELPKVADELPYMHEIKEKYDNIEILEDSANRILLKLNKQENSETIRMILVYNGEGTDIKVNGEAKINVQGNEQIRNFEATNEIKLSEENIGKYSVTTDTASRYKGYLYANAVLENKKDFSFSTTDVVETKDIDITDEIEIENSVDKIVAEEKEVKLNGLVVYKTTSVAVKEFDEAFKENGTIEIFNATGEKIGEINRQSEVKNERYTYSYNVDVDTVIFKIKNIENEKTINIKNDKVIKGTYRFSRDLVKSFKTINTEIINRAVKQIGDEKLVLEEQNSVNSIELQETETKIELNMDKTCFSTQEENEITFNVNLKTNSEQYEVFKNPNIEIEFPLSVEDVKIENINLLHKNGLALSQWKVEKNEAGQRVIKVQLNGEQEEYTPNSKIEATTINILAKVKLDRLTTSSKGLIKLKYSNEGGITSYQLQGKEAEEYEIDYVSRNELLSLLKFENYNDNKGVINTVNTERNIGKLEVESKSKISTVNMNIINNLKQEIQDAVIIGRLPVIGNEDGNQNNLFTTFDITLKSQIMTSGLVAKVYYSEELDATKDSTSWKEEVSDYSKIKCFKIEIQNGIMKQGENIQFNYDLEIPANITYNQASYGANIFYYTLNGEQRVENTIMGVETEKKEITIDDFEDIHEIKNTEENKAEAVQDTIENNQEEGPELLIGTQVTKGGTIVNENEDINERQILRYTTMVKNNSNKPITNIKLKGNAHNANMFYWHTFQITSSTTGEEATTGEWIEDTDNSHTYDTMEIERLLPGESAIFEYQVVVNSITFLADRNEQTVYGQIEISADGIEEQKIETTKNKIVSADIEVHLYKNGQEDITDMHIYSGENYDLDVYVKNISDHALKNVEVNLILPVNIKYSELTEFLHKDYNVTVVETSTQNIVTITLDELPAQSEKTLYLTATIDEIDISLSEISVTVLASVNADGREYISNDYTRTITQDQVAYDIQFYGNKPEGSEVSDGEKLLYTYIVKNKGVLDDKTTISNMIPSGLVYDKVTLYREDGTNEIIFPNETSKEEFGLSHELTIKAGETIKLEIEATVDINKALYLQEKITNYISISSYDDERNVSYIIQYPDGWWDIGDDNNNQEITPPVNNDDNNQEITPPTDDNNNQEITPPVDDNNNQENNPPVDDNNNQEVTPPADNNQEDTSPVDDNNQVLIPKDNVNNNLSTKTTSTYKISGTVWLDENKDGYLDDREQKIDNSKVKLYKENSNKEIAEVKTDKDGKYTFNNVENGKYIILFSYDNEIYNTTKYKNNDIEEKNSKVISENSNYSFAKTDIIEIMNKDVDNINMGLVRKETFDLSIKTYVSSMKLKTKKESQEYTYEEDEFAKVEIASKYIDGAEVTTVLTIKITNNGDIAGYANQIKDIIPEGWIFDESLNKNWTIGKDGYIYCSILENNLIQPEDSIEIKLILTKKMTGETTGTFKNTANIVNSSNKLEVKDENLNNNESSVEFIVSIKTGIVTYLIYVIIITIIISVILIILKKVFKPKNRNILLTSLLLSILCILTLIIFRFMSYAEDIAKPVLPSDKNPKCEGLEYWAVGSNSLTTDSKGLYTNVTPYANIDGYMNNFYGYGNRGKVLGTEFMYYQKHARTQMCMHGTDITSDDDEDIDTDSFDVMTAVGSVDFGWNNGYTKFFNKMTGRGYKEVFADASTTAETESTYYVAQQLGYIGYALDNKMFGEPSGRGYKQYRYAFSYVLKKESALRERLENILGYEIVISKRKL